MKQFGKRVLAADAPSDSQTQHDLHSGMAATKSNAQTESQPSLGIFGLLVGAMLCTLLFYSISVSYGVGVIRDIRLSGTWQPAYDLQALEGKCTRHNFIATFCSANLQSIADPGSPPVESKFATLFTSGGGEQMIPVRSTKDRSVVTIAYAAETVLINRVVSLLLTLSLIALIIFWLLYQLATGQYKS